MSVSTGEANRLWVVEVSGNDPVGRSGLLVMDAETYPEAAAVDLAELQKILDSVEIELLPGS